MGCGSPLGDLFYLADALIVGSYSWQAASHSPALSEQVRRELVRPAWTRGVGDDPKDDLRARLYRMHGEGQISEEVFQALRALAERGQLRPADLAVHLARARKGSHVRGDAAIENALRGVRSRLAQLAQTRAGSEKVLADLKNHLADLDERVAAKEQAARRTVAQDEEIARQRLAEKAELASSRARLESQAQALHADLDRLDDLCSQLAAKSAELESMQARIQLNQEMLK
jgi:hypothetical protein